jgi:predicted AAA+ superfamily ATPase
LKFTHLVGNFHPYFNRIFPTNMQKRNLESLVFEALADTPVIYIRGPRQAGKSTLAQQLIAGGFDARYMTFDESVTLAAAKSDPEAFVTALPPRVILDEVQRAPEIFRAVKLAVDRKRLPGRFVMTGSANALVLPGVADSLAGRMEILTLNPFSQGEREGVRDGFVDACFAKKFSSVLDGGEDWPALTERIAAGGFPDACGRAPGKRRTAWFDSYITTILERDVRDIANVQGLRELPRLLRLAATRIGGLLNLADLSRDAALPLSTLQRYWSLLETTFLVQNLPVWSTNPGLRLVKAPKVFLNDTGLACALLGLDAARLRDDNLMTGALLEAFVVQEIMRQTAWSDARPRMFHFRTHAQQEVDIVLENAAGNVVGIEVKKTSSPSSGDFRGLKALRALAGKKFLRGIVLHTGNAGVSFAPGFFAMPVSSLWKLNSTIN